MTTIEELEKRIQKLERIGKLFDHLLSTVESLIGVIKKIGEEIKLQTIQETLRKIRDKFNKIQSM